MGKARLQAYHAKRDTALAMDMRRRKRNAKHHNGAHKVSAPAPFGGAKRKGGQSINWGVLGATGMRSYDGPKKYLPPPVMPQEQKDARSAFMATLPVFGYECGPITDAMGFAIVDGPVLMDESKPDRGWNISGPYETYAPVMMGDIVVHRRMLMPSASKVPLAPCVGQLPPWNPVSERQHTHTILECMVSRWQAFGGKITECPPGKREKWMRA